MGVGERLSCRIVTAVLRDQVPLPSSPLFYILTHLPAQGIDAELVSLESIVDETNIEEDFPASSSSKLDQGTSGSGQLSQGFYDRLSKKLGERIEACGDRVPVITGQFTSTSSEYKHQLMSVRNE